MNHRELASLNASDFWFDPAVIRPVLVLLEAKAAKIAELYQQLVALCPAAQQAPAAARPTPHAPVTEAAAKTPLNHRKVDPPPPKPAPRPKAPPVDVAALAKRAPAGKRDSRILALVTQHKGLTASELAQKLDTSVPNAYSVLQRLVRDRRLTCGALRKYHIVVDPDAVESVN